MIREDLLRKIAEQDATRGRPLTDAERIWNLRKDIEDSLRRSRNMWRGMALLNAGFALMCATAAFALIVFR